MKFVSLRVVEEVHAGPLIAGQVRSQSVDADKILRVRQADYRGGPYSCAMIERMSETDLRERYCIVYFVGGDVLWIQGSEADILKTLAQPPNL